MFAFELIEPWRHQFGYWHTCQTTVEWSDKSGFLDGCTGRFLAFLTRFLPSPPVLLAWVFIPFVLASIIDCCGHFFLVAGLIWWGGAYESLLRRYIDRLGWLFSILALVLYLIVTVK